MDLKHLSVGDEVVVSWREDEGGGWYSNKRNKNGVIRETEGGEKYVSVNLYHTAPPVKVFEMDIKAVRLASAPLTKG